MKTKACSKDCSCPNCNSASSLTDYWTLFLTIEQWPAALISLSLISIASNLLMLSPSWTGVFALVSIIPLLFTITKKKSCLLCGIEFEDRSSETLRISPISKYE